jgi:RNA polymerase sigma-70 factor (ECF subfamily)
VNSVLNGGGASEIDGFNIRENTANEISVSSSKPMPTEGAPIENEDTELVIRCQRGDMEAFNSLVTRYRQRTYAMIYHMVHNEQDAWDLAQDSFLKAWKSIARFRGQSSFYTWLYRIVTNVTIDWLRKKQIQSGTEFDDQIGLQHIEPAAVTLPKADLLPLQKLEGDEIRQRINAAIERLSPEHRAVILMREIDGLQYDEIAAAMDCSIGTVMSRLFYARKKLQTLLTDVYENL